MQYETLESDWMFSIKTDIGWLCVKGNRYFVTGAGFVFEQPEADYGDGSLRDTAFQQVSAYLRDPSTTFDLPIATLGTEFQQKTWTALESIPPGETLSYGQLAQRLGSSAQAIGGACRHNPVAVIVPCHRVVAAHGIGGYAGDTAGRNLQVKQWLLEREVHG